MEEILHKLEEAIEIEDWDVVQESIDMLRELIIDNPFDDYDINEW